MNPLTRALLWTAAALAPGGFMLLPLLVGAELRAKRRQAAAEAPR